MSIFFYPRGLQGPYAARRRFDVPSFYNGPVDCSSILPLAAALERRMKLLPMPEQVRARSRVWIDLSRDGTRQVVTGRRIWPTSIYPSRKCGAAIVCEGANELLFALYCEADPGVLSYATQAVHFEVQVNGRAQHYHADFVRNLANGTVEIVEIKPNASYLEKPRYRDKLEAVEELCRAIGWQFRVYFGQDLRRRTFSNFHISQIQADRFLRIRPAVEHAVVECLHTAREGVEIGDLVSLCGDDVLARATLNALACRSILHFDIANQVRSDTVVRLIDRRAA